MSRQKVIDILKKNREPAEIPVDMIMAMTVIMVTLIAIVIMTIIAILTIITAIIIVTFHRNRIRDEEKERMTIIIKMEVE